MAGKKNPIKNSSSAIESLAMGNTISKFKPNWTGWIAILMFLTLAHSAAASQGFTQNTDGNQTVFNQTDMKVYNEVDSYTISENEIHIYNQPSADAVFLQRVTGADASSILGKLTANGQVWIINPSGVLIGSKAVINTAGFLAAAATLDQEDFFNGKYGLTQSGAGGSVVNNGSINAENGYVVLAGASVSNAGSIAAGQGDVVLAAGSAMTFDFYGDGLINFAVDAQTAARVMGPDADEMKTAVHNSGTICAARVLMTANAARDIFESVVNNEGVIEADSASGNGTITLSSSGSGAVVHSGELIAGGKSGKIQIASNDDVLINGVVVVEDDGSISIVADQNRDASGDLDIGRTSSATIAVGEGNIDLAGNNVRLDQSVVATGQGNVDICAAKGYSNTGRTVFDVAGSVNIDPADPADHSTTQGSASIDWSTVSDSNVNFNPGADVKGKTINVESDMDAALAAYPNYGDIVFHDGQATGREQVTLDANLGNIYCTDGGLVTSLGDAQFTAQLVGTVPTVVRVYHSDPAYPVNYLGTYQTTLINAGAVNVDIGGTLYINAQSMANGISGVLDGTAGYLNIDSNTPGVIIWNGTYIDHAGPMARAYSEAIAQLNAYNVNELGGVEDLRKGSEYYGGGVPYEGLVLDNRARFDIFNAGVFDPYPDLITDLRLMKACEED
jgi:filamentous hemagglutinin family protein